MKYGKAPYHVAVVLINIGAYKKGSNPDFVYAIEKIGAVNDYVMQQTDEKFEFEEEVNMLEQIFEA